MDHTNTLEQKTAENNRNCTMWTIAQPRALSRRRARRRRLRRTRRTRPRMRAKQTRQRTKQFTVRTPWISREGSRQLQADGGRDGDVRLRQGRTDQGRQGTAGHFCRVSWATPKSYILEVTGGTDSTGSAAYNYDLSQRRADSVVQYLAAKYGIAAHRFYLIGIGKDKEVAPNTTAEGRKQNRRVEVQLLSNMSTGEGAAMPQAAPAPSSN